MSALLDRMERQATILRRPPSLNEQVREQAALVDLEELAAREQRDWKARSRALTESGDPLAAEGINYVDSLPPFNQADFTAVTLLTTSLMLYPAAVWAPTAAGSYWWPGKTLCLRAFGKITTAATPGNLTVELRLATTDAGGTLLATSAAQTLIASQTNISWRVEMFVECRAVGSGSAGSLFAWGHAQFGAAVIAAGTFLIPASAAAAVGVDTTAASGLSLQAKRSGSTVETMTVQDVQRESRN